MGTKLKFSQLKKHLSAANEDTLYYLEGDDAYFHRKAVEMITGKFVTALPELNSVTLSSRDIKEIYSSCSVLPFMSEKRVVLLREWYPSEADLKQLEKWGQNPACVLVASNLLPWPPLKKYSERHTFVDCGKENAPTLAGWIAQIMAAEGKEIDRDAAFMLAEYCSCDMVRIDSEIGKLKHLPGAVTAKDIEENVSKDVEYQAYMLASAVAEGKGNPYRIIREYVSKGDARAHTQLLASLYNNFRRMYYVKGSSRGEEELGRLLGVKPYAVSASARAARKFKKAALKKALKLISAAEYRIKSGSMGSETALYFAVASLLRN